MTASPGPHNYLSCEEAEDCSQKYSQALKRIMERCDGTAWNIAAAALGHTFIPSEKGPDSRDRFIEKVKGERDQARADVLKLREALSMLVPRGVNQSTYERERDGLAPANYYRQLISDTEHYEQYR